MGFNWPLINDNITEQDKKVMSNFILNSNRFTNGPKVKEFEQIWSNGPFEPRRFWSTTRQVAC